MSAIFLQGNALTVLRGLPADFFHCAATSPPYFGLRRYAGGEEVWDGDPNCEHSWQSVPPRRTRKASDIVDVTTKEATNRGNLGIELPYTNTCSKCGAWRGQLGNEPTPDLYISHLVQICREVRRVLRPDGVFWLNIGDSWASGKGTCFNPGGGLNSLEGHARLKDARVYSLNRWNKSDLEVQGMKPLDMVLIPEQLALALRTDGWYVRSLVVWKKDNPMPESVSGWRWERHEVRIKARTRGSNEGSMPPQTHHAGQVPHRDGSFDTPSDTIWQDCPGCPKCSPHGGYILRKGSWRPTDSYEFILMLTKTGSYFCDKEAVLERGLASSEERYRYPFGDAKNEHLMATDNQTVPIGNRVFNGGRNLRSVWEFPTKPYSGAHFAVFPPRLPELCVKASTSEKGCCPKCGSPWARVLGNRTVTGTEGWGVATEDHTGDLQGSQSTIREGHGRFGTTLSCTTGWLSTCQCSVPETSPCRVLDPFSGAGTTALVCERLGIDSVSIDTSPEYIKLSQDRLVEDEKRRIAEMVKLARKLARVQTSNPSDGHKEEVVLTEKEIAKVSHTP